MDFENFEIFEKILKKHMQNVHSYFKELLVTDDSKEKDEVYAKINGIWHNLLEKQEAVEILTTVGFEKPDEILKKLDLLRNDLKTRTLSTEGREKLDKLMPIIIKKAGDSEESEIIFTRIIELIKTIQQRRCYTALLLENPNAIDHLIKLAKESPWIISFLSRHPLLLDELIDQRTLYVPPSKEEIQNDLKSRLNRILNDDSEHQIEELCVFKHINTLRIAAADVSGNFPLMKVSDHLTDLAEIIVGQTLSFSWDNLLEKYGKPENLKEKTETGFAVIAYGKLGGIELGYSSDLDLVFLHSGKGGYTQGGKRSIDDGQFYIRLGQRIIHTLTLRTPTGVLYETDMRLRPSGISGLIVSNIDSFRDYHANSSWTWEHQALVRARPICGDPTLLKAFEEVQTSEFNL